MNYLDFEELCEKAATAIEAVTNILKANPELENDDDFYSIACRVEFACEEYLETHKK